MGDVMSDPLARATRALREKHAATSLEGDPGTRDRVLERAMRDGRERRIGRVVLLPIAATFVLFATWAAATGRLPSFLGQKGAPETSEPAPPSPAPQAPGTARPAPPPADPEPAAPPAPSAEPTASTPSAAHAPAPHPERPAPEPHVPSAEDTLYAAAHAAHFDDRDAPRALAAWDAYLAKAPAGRFAPEARYNRALCLVRLGRTSEAKAALAPFADGTMGGYRRSEATKLLERMGE